MFVNRMPRYEVLSEEALEALDRGWRRLASEVGVELLHPRALALLQAAGQRVDGERVRFDPDFLLEQAAKAPSSFTLHARNPQRSVVVGGDHMVFVPVQGPPNVIRDGVRRTSTLADFDDLCRFAQAVDELDSAGGLPVETNDVPVEVRHLEHVRSLVRLTDKLFQGSQISGLAARDSLALGELVFGERLERGACMYTNVNVNSPLRWDDRMLEALLVYAEAGQAVVIVPFLLMGAMAPVSVPAALVQQTVEALAGIAVAQLVRPGCPVVMGGFLSNVDMQSGAPGVRRAGVGARAPLHGADRSSARAPVARRGRLADVEPHGRRAGGVRGAHHDDRRVPRGGEPRAAHDRLARVRSRDERGEGRDRPRARPRPARGVHAARDRRGEPRARRAHRGRAGRATSSARRTR